MSKWQKFVKVLPFCVVGVIVIGLLVSYIAIITIFKAQNDEHVTVTNLFSFRYFKSNPSKPEPRSDHWWMNRHNQFVRKTAESNGTIPIIFYGDSIMEGWGANGRHIFQQQYAKLGVVNYGISADRTEHLLWRVQNGEITGLSPKLIVLMIGTNNLGQTHHSNSEIANGVNAILEYMHENIPLTKILLLSILPKDSEHQCKRIMEINQLIAKLADNSTTYYLDMFDNFAYDPPVMCIRNEFYYDGLHLTAAGYKEWAYVMDPLFRRLISEE